MNRLLKQCGNALAIAAYVFMGANSASAAITFPDTPLPVSGTAKNNLMILFDTSGSMRATVPEANGDISDVTDDRYKGDSWLYAQGACASPVGSASRVFDGIYLKIRSGGDTEFWGTTGDLHCFNPNSSYSIQLQETDFVPGGRGTATYTGNFLNWYFCKVSTVTGYCSTATPDPFETITETRGSYTYTSKRRVNSRDRLWVGKAAMGDFVESLTGLEVGLATYAYADRNCINSATRPNCGNSASRAMIRHGIEDIDTGTQKADIQATLDAITIDGNTPLASSFATIGRYFVEGYTGQSLIKGANTYAADVGDTITSSTMFSVEPDYDTGVATPTSADPVIEESCENSFLLAVTDGAPSADSIYSSDIGNYNNLTNNVALGVDLSGDMEDWGSTALVLNDMDLRTDLSDGDASIDSAEDTQNITSYIVGFGAGLSSTVQAQMEDIATLGGGEYISATDQASLTTALNSMASNSKTANGSIASVAFNATQLDTGSAIFQAKFHSENWTGSLEAFELNGNTGEVLSPKVWEAREKLEGMVSSGNTTNRVILSYKAGDGVAFTTATAQSAAMQSDLNEADSLAQDRLDYLRGDRVNEGSTLSTLRTREAYDVDDSPYGGVLGDIVNSSPVYVGKPENNWPDTGDFGTSTERYSTYLVGAAATRTPVVYVGANDGMLHGFNASIATADSATFGKEVLAYVPGIIANAAAGDGLSYLSDQGYAHKDYVDLTPTIADVYIDTVHTGTPTSTDRDWKTVLIGGLRAGGKGYFALDVTDPTQFAEANASDLVLWEFTSADDSDLGYSFSRPVVAMMNNGKWAAIFGNGYESAAGKATLFIVFIEEGADGVWTLTDDYRKIEADSGSGNGLSAPAIADLDGDGTADRIYAGDLMGNMYAFDVSGNGGNGGNAWVLDYTLFTAEDSGGTPQPITAAPILATNTAYSGGGNPNVMVMFGTGKYIEVSDITDVNQQAFYAVSDNGSGGFDSGDLAEREWFSDVVTDSGGVNFLIRYLDDPDTTADETPDPVVWSGGGAQHGWYMNLVVGSGTEGAERVVTSPLLRRDVLFFNTIIPNTSKCDGAGSGWFMSLDFSSGLPLPFGVFDANKDGVINDGDAGAIGEYSGSDSGLLSQPAILGDHRYITTSTGELMHDEISTGDNDEDGRRGWEEVILH